MPAGETEEYHRFLRMYETFRDFLQTVQRKAHEENPNVSAELVAPHLTLIEKHQRSQYLKDYNRLRGKALSDFHTGLHTRTLSAYMVIGVNNSSTDEGLKRASLKQANYWRSVLEEAARRAEKSLNQRHPDFLTPCAWGVKIGGLGQAGEGRVNLTRSPEM